MMKEGGAKAPLFLVLTDPLGLNVAATGTGRREPPSKN
jgi:hypothetical protein